MQMSAEQTSLKFDRTAAGATVSEDGMLEFIRHLTFKGLEKRFSAPIREIVSLRTFGSVLGLNLAIV